MNICAILKSAIRSCDQGYVIAELRQRFDRWCKGQRMYACLNVSALNAVELSASEDRNFIARFQWEEGAAHNSDGYIENDESLRWNRVCRQAFQPGQGLIIWLSPEDYTFVETDR